MSSTARDTLEKARYFAASAAAAQPDDVVAFRHNLEAAIVFARSVTFHVQKEFAHAPGFNEWYEDWQRRLAADRGSRFFLETRNFLLKEGKLGVSRHISFRVNITASAKLTASATVIRGKPWYRRSPRIILEDLVYPARVWLRRRRDKREEDRKRAQRSEPKPPVIGMYFADPQWNDRPALDHFGEYLRLLETLVNECESRFLRYREPEGG